jgi:DNA-directed RNA polymerase subunit RPC12/RpoP
LSRLYLEEAKGICDDELINDVGMYLYMRCRDILTVKLAREDKKVRCPVCDNVHRETFIQRHGEMNEIIKCPVCGWEIVWEDYLKAVKRKQLNAGGAVKAFEEFMRRFEKANSPRERILAIDRLIHEFHYSAKERPEQPTRPVGVNLIEGNLKSVIDFLNDLTSGNIYDSQIMDNRRQWERNLHAFETIDWESIVNEGREKKRMSMLPGV